MTAPQPAAERAEHWDAVYTGLHETQVSWFEPEPTYSLEMLDAVGANPGQPVIDVGAGASRLVDALLARGHTDMTALDVSDDGLAVTRRRLGPDAERVHWIVADLLAWTPPRRYDTWHDRAVFHFLTDPDDRIRYRDLLDSALAPGARVVIGTFGEDGPQHCSGLPTARYSATGLAKALGGQFEVVTTRRELHRTPSGTMQPFTWLALRERG